MREKTSGSMGSLRVVREIVSVVLGRVSDTLESVQDIWGGMASDAWNVNVQKRGGGLFGPGKFE